MNNAVVTLEAERPKQSDRSKVTEGHFHYIAFAETHTD